MLLTGIKWNGFLKKSKNPILRYLLANFLRPIFGDNGSELLKVHIKSKSAGASGEIISRSQHNPNLLIKPLASCSGAQILIIRCLFSDKNNTFFHYTLKILFPYAHFE